MSTSLKHRPCCPDNATKSYYLRSVGRSRQYLDIDRSQTINTLARSGGVDLGIVSLLSDLHCDVVSDQV